MGIGVPDVQEIWKWYRKFLGINIRVFEDAADAPLMINYTGGKVQSRTASLALSMESGGGFEIWQYTSRNTEKADFNIQLGDYGFYACRIKSRNVKESYDFFKKNGADIVGELFKACLEECESDLDVLNAAFNVLIKEKLTNDNYILFAINLGEDLLYLAFDMNYVEEENSEPINENLPSF